MVDNIRIFTMNPDGSDLQKIYHIDPDKTDERSCYLYYMNCHQFYISPDYKYLIYHNAKATYIMRPYGKDLRSFNADYRAFQWSHDGKYLAYAHKQNEKYVLFVANADGSNERQLADHGVTDLAWSPDNKYIAFSSLGSIMRINIEGKSRLNRLANEDVLVDRVSWSPDGQYMAYVHRSALYLIDAETWIRQKAPDYIGYYNYGMGGYEWSPDGSKLLINQTFLLNVNNFEKRSIPDPFGGRYVAPGFRWSPDGSRLLYTAVPYIWNISEDSQIRLRLPLNDHRGWGEVAAWSPDGQQIVYVFGGLTCIMNVNNNTDHHCIIDPSDFNYGGVTDFAWSAEMPPPAQIQ